MIQLLDRLPKEIIIRILLYLDLTTLHRCLRAHPAPSPIAPIIHYVISIIMKHTSLHIVVAQDGRRKLRVPLRVTGFDPSSESVTFAFAGSTPEWRRYYKTMFLHTPILHAIRREVILGVDRNSSPSSPLRPTLTSTNGPHALPHPNLFSLTSFPTPHDQVDGVNLPAYQVSAPHLPPPPSPPLPPPPPPSHHHHLPHPTETDPPPPPPSSLSSLSAPNYGLRRRTRNLLANHSVPKIRLNRLGIQRLDGDGWSVIMCVERRLDGEGPRAGKPQRSGERWLRVLGAECSLRFLVGLSTHHTKSSRAPWTRWWTDRTSSSSSSSSSTFPTLPKAPRPLSSPSSSSAPRSRISSYTLPTPNISRASSTDFSHLPRSRRSWWFPSSVIKFAPQSSSSSSNPSQDLPHLRGATSMIEIRSMPCASQQDEAQEPHDTLS
ncbi:MAG: hypothetical protein DHS80DRAFT_26406 [Piptocephalis tieghemiana]|nr:MAG: hypothetical protein DHS80DRAFT_26406 [Piptocephalis tieghemiana]